VSSVTETAGSTHLVLHVEPIYRDRPAHKEGTSMQSVSLGNLTLLAILGNASCAIDPEIQPTEDVTDHVTQESIIPDQFSFFNQNSHRCLDAALQSINNNGTTIQLWDCNSGDQQIWQLDTTEIGQWTRVINAHSHRCLDAALQSINSNGTTIQLWDCNGGDQQLWRLTNSHEIQNVHSGRCLDAALQSINNNGTKVQLWDCNGGTQQKWF
jgi:hypothetical protein